VIEHGDSRLREGCQWQLRACRSADTWGIISEK